VSPAGVAIPAEDACDGIVDALLFSVADIQLVKARGDLPLR
jgi:hypothetical protein